MGLYSTLWPISPDIYQHILEHPRLVSCGILGEGSVDDAEELERLKPLLPEIAAALKTSGLDLERHWEGIHDLLCGTQEADNRPISWVILGGSEIDGNLGDAARILTPDAVQKSAAALEKISPAEFAERLEREKKKDPVRYADAAYNEKKLKLYAQLRELYLEAAKKKQAMLLYLA